VPAEDAPSGIGGVSSEILRPPSHLSMSSNLSMMDSDDAQGDLIFSESNITSWMQSRVLASLPRPHPCYTRELNNVLEQAGSWTRGSGKKTAYAYIPLSYSLRYGRRNRFPPVTTDCSGLVSHVLLKCGMFEKAWRKLGRGWWPRRSGVTPAIERNTYKRITAAAYYRGFRRDDTASASAWVRVPGLKDTRPGDLATYQISRACGQDGGARDSGHIMFVRETPVHLGTVRCDGTMYHRYKMKVADASKNMHFGHGSRQDTRVKCFRDENTYGAVPRRSDMRRLGCGVGEGWIYAWARTCPSGGCQTPGGKRHAIYAVRLFPRSDRADGPTRCPPQRSLDCHKYRIGRFIRRR